MLSRLAEVGLPESVLGKKPAELSGGMRKRVGLARALALEPEIMLYDEPTTGLDPIMSDVINELILSTRRQHPVTSVVVTHDMRTARKVADRVVMLYPLVAAGPGRAADHLRRPARRLDAAAERRVRAVRPRRGGRTADGNAGGKRRLNHGRTRRAIPRRRDGAGHAAHHRHPRRALRRSAARLRQLYHLRPLHRGPGRHPPTRPIRKSGILIGRVSRRPLRRGRHAACVVTAEIDANRKVYHDEACCINNSLIGIGGDTVLEFVRSTAE